MNDNQRMASEILERIGGMENVSNVMHCVTRLRFTLKDQSLADTKAVEAVKGVVGVKVQNGQYQVIIGQKVGDVYAETLKLGNFEGGSVEEKPAASDKEKQGFQLKKVGAAMIDGIVSSIVPALPILIGGGMFKVIAMLLLKGGMMQPDNSTYLILLNIGEASFYFLPVFIGINAAKKFHASISMSALVCAFLLLPAFANGVADGTINTVFGLPITKANYPSTVLPSIMIVWVLAKVEAALKKVIPEILRTVLLPTLTLLIMVPVAITAIGPLGVILGNYMAAGLMFVYNKFGFIGMGIMGALRPLLIFTGMHTSLMPFAIGTLSETGYEPFFLVTGMGYVFGSGFACLAVALKCKAAENKASAFTCAITALLGGVTEPSLYGILMKYKRPLIAVICGGFASGCYFGLTHTYAYAMVGSTGIFGIPALIGPTSANLVNGLIALAISCAVSFVITLVLGFDENAEVK